MRTLFHGMFDCVCHLVHVLTQEMPVSKKVRIRTFSVRIRTCFRVRFLKKSRANCNQMRASDGLAYWTVIGHPKVHTKIGFAANNQVSEPVWGFQQLENISFFVDFSVRLKIYF